MKKLHLILVSTLLLNLFITCGWIGVVYSEDVMVESSALTSSSIMDSSPQVQLSFTKSGGVLETAIWNMYVMYKTEVFFAELDSGAPIPDATIKIQGDIDKANRNSRERGSGIYYIEITPNQNGRLSFEIEASKEGYGTSSVKLVLSVGLTPSQLLFLSNNQPFETGEVEINSTYTTYVNFTKTDGPIDNANIEVFGRFSELSVNTTSIDSGLYRVNISIPEVGQEIYFGIEASADGVATSSVDLILTVTPFQTALRFTSNKISRETNQGRVRVNINQTYTTEVQYNRTSTSPETPIDDATLRVVPSAPGIAHSITPLGSGRYQITVSSNESKQFSVDIEAAKSWFSNASATLTLDVSLIPASLQVMNPDFKENRLNVTYTDPINVIVRFQDENGPLAWDNYTIDSGGLTFHSLAPDDELGHYILLFNASSQEIYNVKLNATASGHEAAILNIVVSADPIPMIYELNIKNGEIQGSIININESRSANITLTLLESHVPSHPDDNKPIGGADVKYSWEGGEGYMEYLGNGTYTMDLSGDRLKTGTAYQFKITAEKDNFKLLEITKYSVVIKPKPPSKYEQLLTDYWYIVIGGIIVSFGLLGYIFRRRQQYRNELALFEEKKRLCYELVSDILSFQDLLIISTDGSLIYGFRASTSDDVSEESLHSAFMMALKTFAGESIMLDELKGEDHFRFGETEIFLVSGDMATFAFLYEAQMIDEEWRRVSAEMLDRCRESVAAIEFEFQEALQGYQLTRDSALIPKEKITHRISGILELDVGMAYKLTGKKLQIDEPYLPNKKVILDSVQQLEEERDVITLTTLLESLGDLGVPTDEAVFIFYQLRSREMIQPKE